MIYNGKYDFFDFGQVSTYPIAGRPNLVSLDDLIDPASCVVSEEVVTDDMRRIAARMLECREKGLPVTIFMGAHPIKNGLSPLLIEWIKAGLVSHIATNGAGCIHDFELGLIGETSENVPNALPQGTFGQAYETGHCLNSALRLGYDQGLGYGESVARMMTGELQGIDVDCPHADRSLMVQAYRAGVPFTVHVSIGSDIIHQHPNFDGASTGGASGLDFGVFTATIARYTEGGLFINVGSAVAGPEVLLKAVSMVSNVGQVPKGMDTAVFDFRRVEVGDDATDVTKPQYYYRDFKSIVVRIPAACGGTGCYIRGDIMQTLPCLSALLRDE